MNFITSRTTTISYPQFQAKYSKQIHNRTISSFQQSHATIHKSHTNVSCIMYAYASHSPYNFFFYATQSAPQRFVKICILNAFSKNTCSVENNAKNFLIKLCFENDAILCNHAFQKGFENMLAMLFKKDFKPCFLKMKESCL